MPSHASKTRILVVTFAYGALGTGVFAGCGEPGQQSQNSGSRPTTKQTATDSQPGVAPAATTGLRHSTSDELALSRPARAGNAPVAKKSQDSVAPCDETEYATDTMEDSSQLRREGSDPSALCDAP